MLKFCRPGFSDRCVAKAGFSWYSKRMEQTPFELTPAQKSLLTTLSRETGKPIPALIAEALEELQEHVHRGHDRNGDAATPQEACEGSPEEPPKPSKPFWQKVLEASERIPEEELQRVPTDLAAQVDHYIYGTPKR